MANTVSVKTTLDLDDTLLQTWELAWQRHFLVHGGDFWRRALHAA